MYINLAMGFLAASLVLLVFESLGVFSVPTFRKVSLLAGLACVLLGFLKGRDAGGRNASRRGQP